MLNLFKKVKKNPFLVYASSLSVLTVAAGVEHESDLRKKEQKYAMQGVNANRVFSVKNSVAGPYLEQEVVPSDSTVANKM